MASSAIKLLTAEVLDVSWTLKRVVGPLMQFFVLTPLVGSEAETSFESDGRPRLGEAPRCRACDQFVGQRPWLPPYRARLRYHGAELGDIAFDLADATELLVSDILLAAWQRSALRGLGEVEAADILSVEPRPAPRGTVFFHTRAQRTTTTIDWTRSVFRPPRRPSCDLCGGPGIIDAILSLDIDQASWSGDDIFVPWGLNGRVVVTQRVVELARAEGLRNVTTIPISEYRWEPLHSRSGA